MAYLALVVLILSAAPDLAVKGLLNKTNFLLLSYAIFLGSLLTTSTISITKTFWPPTVPLNLCPLHGRPEDVSRSQIASGREVKAKNFSHLTQKPC